MKLGILVNKERHLREIIEITMAAVSKGHRVNIFVVEEGVNILSNPDFIRLHEINGVRISFCDYSSKELNIFKENIPEEIICGSQMNNAAMVHESDRVIVL
ncbi:MAG: DsrE family protein [Nitrospirae bacterium]|nr:DsrE family protein [Nitrospirota bacterium]